MIQFNVVNVERKKNIYVDIYGLSRKSRTIVNIKRMICVAVI